jgi:uncharacterized RDD family membrane protein YckC
VGKCVIIKEDTGEEMEGQIHENNQKNISLNLDEFDIDSYDFKPITKGLGFHEPKKKQASFPKTNQVAKRATSEKRVMSSNVTHQMPKKDYLQNTPLSVSDPSLMSGIEALYKKEQTVQKKTEAKIEKKIESRPQEEKVTKASHADQFLAFFLDVFIIAFISLSLFACFFYAATGKIDYKLGVEFIKTSLPYAATLSALIFLTYFSMTEPVGTIGKRFLDLGTFKVKGKKRVTIRQSFIRSTITLFSLFLLGLPLILDFQGKLSDSRVLKN